MILAILLNVVFGAIGLIFLILVHELAHLVVAKACKCGVEVFSVGFGKAIWKKKIGTTIYRLSWIPFGGYCALKGELEAKKAKNTFINLPYLKKFAISIAGCTVNILLGIITMFCGVWFQVEFLYYFGYVSLALGIGNLVPIASCLDGGYIVYYPLYCKVYGKKKGTLLFAKSVKTSFKVLNWINILCIPYIIYVVYKFFVNSI